MIKLRPYQEEAVNAAAKAISSGKNRILLILPTASGKSILAGAIAGRACQKGNRILILCHQEQLLRQNEEKINLMFPEIKTGIYCAGAGRKQTNEQIILASRDSLGRNPTVCGQFDGIIIDEAHTVAVDIENSDTMYAKILNAQNPKWILGETGTPFRLNNGRIFGPGKFFETVAYNIPMGLLRSEGFLVPYHYPKIPVKINAGEQCRKSSTGDFVIKDLEEIASTKDVITDCVKTWMSHAADRKCSLFFCVSRKHARLTHEILCKFIPPEECAYIDGESKDREEIMQGIRAGRYRVVVNVLVIAVGFDAPIIDCIVMLRATQSVALFIQAVGRGLRTAPGKSDCMVLDMTDNLDRFGSIENPFVKQVNAAIGKKPTDEDNEEKETFKKLCYICGFQEATKTYCPFCGEVFRNHSNKPFDGTKVETILLRAQPYCQNYITKNKDAAIRIIYPIVKDNVVSNPAEYFLVQKYAWAKANCQRRIAQLKKGKAVSVQAKLSGGLIDVKEIYFAEEDEDENEGSAGIDTSEILQDGWMDKGKGRIFA